MRGKHPSYYLEAEPTCRCGDLSRSMSLPSTIPSSAGPALVRRHASPECHIHQAGILHIRLLGPIAVRWGAVPVQLPTKGSRSLLAVLAIRGGIEYRESVAADLWPERGTRSAAALRQALWLLRGGLANAGAEPDAVIDADDELIGLVDERVEVDVARFEHLLLKHPRAVEEAVALYRGDLCVSHAPDFFVRERERLADLFEDALADLAQRRLRAGDWDGARQAATALLHRDALREEGHAILIELFGHVGSRSQVARQYRRLRQVLAQELHVTPLPETEAAYSAALLATYERSNAAVAGVAAR